MPLFTGGRYIAVTVDLGRERFVQRAAALRAADGTALADLFIRRADLEATLPLVKRAGLSFGVSG